MAGIWKKSDPAPTDDHISSKDFSFVLPVVELPPAGLYGHESLLQCVYPAAVSYIVEGVGVTLQVRPRVRAPPAGSPEQSKQRFGRQGQDQEQRNGGYEMVDSRA